MRLTTKSEYALLSLTYISRKKTGEYIHIDKICSQYDISKKYLQQIFNILRTSGYIKTKPGVNGGYKLAKKPNEITVAEIIRLMDGPLAPIDSVSTYFFSHNKLEKEEKIISILKEIRDYVSNKLENITLDELI